MRICQSIEETVGGTPLVRLARLERYLGLHAELVAKVESANPAGSAKDRVAVSMINAAERAGRLREGGVIIEPTSGNTGLGLAMVAAVRGYRAIIVMPDSMSEERRRLMRAYGAELVLTDGALGMRGAIARAEQMAREIPGSYLPSQFENPANAEAHLTGTGPELWRDTDGQLDVFVAGVGTGGTLTGVGEYLRQKKPDVRLIAVEPKGSPVLSGGSAGAHGLQGIGAGFVPAVLNTAIYDEVITVSEEDAYRFVRLLGRREGILAGISSGAALCAAVEVASRPESAGLRIAVLLPDTGERYLSTSVFAEEQ